MTASGEQRNRYKGLPERAWLHINVVAPDGTMQELDLLADTGNPCAVIIGSASMAQSSVVPGPSMNTNFGLLVGGHVRVVIPDVGFDQLVLTYASDAVVAAAQTSSPDFAGLIGLPLLRLLTYGGDCSEFWIRAVSAAP